MKKYLLLSLMILACLTAFAQASDYWEIDMARGKIAYQQNLLSEAQSVLQPIALDHQDAGVLYLMVLKDQESPEFDRFATRFSDKWGESDAVKSLQLESYCKRGLYGSAIGAFQSMKKPTHMDEYHAGIAATMRKQDCSKILFKRASKDPAVAVLVKRFEEKSGASQSNIEPFMGPTSLRKKISRLNASGQASEDKKWKMFFSIGAEYSDNAAFRPSDTSLPYRYKNESDASMFAYLSGNYELYRSEDYLVDAGASIYKSYYFHLDDFDLWGTLFELNFYKFSEDRDARWRFSVLPEYFWIQDDSFLRRYAAELEYMKKWNDDFASKLQYRFEDNTYFTAEKRTGLFHQLKLTNMYRVNDSWSLGLATAVGRSNAHNDYDYMEYLADAYGYWNISERNKLKMGLEFIQQNHQHRDRGALRKRHDTSYNPYLSYFYFLKSNIYLNLRYDFQRNDSDFARFDYDRSTVRASLNFSF